VETAISNRRRCVRQKVHSPVYLSTNNESAATLLDLNEVFDISIRGLSFQGQAPLEVGQRIYLRLEFSETGSAIHSFGRVAWSDAAGRTGVRFRKMPRPTFRQLKEWLFLNLLAACVQHEAARLRAKPSGVLSAPETAPDLLKNSPSVSLETSDSSDYGTILITLAAIRREIEACGSRVQPMLQRLVEHSRTVVCASGAAIAISNGQDMICRAVAGANVPALGARVVLEASFSGECVRRGRLLRCDDTETHPLVDRESCRALGIRSMMAIPLRYGDVDIGLLEVFSTQPQAFRWKDEVYLRHLAEIALDGITRALKAVSSPATFETPGLPANGSPVNLNPLGFESVESRGQGPGEAIVGGSDSEGPGADSKASASGRFRKFALASVAAVIVVAMLVFFSSRRRRAEVVEIPKNAVSGSGAAQKKFGQAGVPAGDLDRLRQQAEEGDAAAQFALGARYATGDEVVQDYSTAAHWFALAAAQGHVVAQATLGAYFWMGRGVPQDFDRAYYWSILAKAGGDEGSKYRIPALASHLSRQQIVADQEQANDWIKQHQLVGNDSRSPSGNSKD
jgi:putative methionine-R-sulfoxide reductase with GAF domain